MKLFVDDVREAPGGWTLARTCEEGLNHLATGRVVELSLDHDMGLDENGVERMNGYQMLTWIHKAVMTGKFKYPPSNIAIHSSNPAVIVKMNQMARDIVSTGYPRKGK